MSGKAYLRDGPARNQLVPLYSDPPLELHVPYQLPGEEARTAVYRAVVGGLPGEVDYKYVGDLVEAGVVRPSAQ